MRPLGFVLSFCAIVAFLLHPIHSLTETHSGTSSHCCVCHTVPMGAVRPQTDHAPGTFLVFTVSVLEEARQFGDILSAESPRGPPYA
jgi:hypothetical protein